jgi:beta-glucanase (GH16 family)
VLIGLLLVAPGCESSLDFVSAGEAPQGPLGPPGKWRLSFAEECDAAELDRRRWNTFMVTGNVEYRSWGQRADWMADENVSLQGGLCVITAENQPSGDRPYTSGTLNTARLFEQQYGYFEARLKPPAGRGFWTAWWLRDVAGWPPAIDILTLMGEEPTLLGTGLWWTGELGRESDSQSFEMEDLSADFHVYGVEWTATELIFYFDGQELRRTTRGVDSVQRPLFPTLNLSISTGEVGLAPDASTPWPGRLEIDWVRVYEEVND